MIVEADFHSTFTTLAAAESHAERIRVQGSSILIEDMPCVAVQSRAGDQLILVRHEERGDGFAACKPPLKSEWRIGEFAKVIMSQPSVQVLTTKAELQPAAFPISSDIAGYDTEPAIDLVCRLKHWLVNSPGGSDDE